MKGFAVLATGRNSTLFVQALLAFRYAGDIMRHPALQRHIRSGLPL